eukprot:296344-Amphidinium_carterae.1
MAFLLEEWFEGTVALDPMWDLVSILNRVPVRSSILTESQAQERHDRECYGTQRVHSDFPSI